MYPDTLDQIIVSSDIPEALGAFCGSCDTNERYSHQSALVEIAQSDDSRTLCQLVRINYDSRSVKPHASCILKMQH